MTTAAGAPAERYIFSLQYYKKRAVYHSNTLIIGAPWGDLCLIAEGADDAGTLLVRLALL
jgi:hypothetical protein